MALFGGSAPGGRSWEDTLAILGAMLQDTGSAYNGRPGGALQGIQKQFKTLADQKAYQDTLKTSFGTPELAPIQSTPQITHPSQLAIRQAEGAYNQPTMMFSGPTGQALGYDQANALLPMLQGLDPQQGLPVLLNAMTAAQTRKDGQRDDAVARAQKLSDSAITRSQDFEDKSERPMTAEEKARANLSPEAPAFINGMGKVNVVDDPNSMTAYQKEMLARQRASDAETARHNRAQEASGREGEGGLFSMIDTPSGMYGVTRGGDVRPMNGPDGKPLVSYHSDPSLRYDMSAAQAGGRAGGTMAEALPTAEASFSLINKTLDGFDLPEVKAQAGRSLGFVDSKLPTIPGYNSGFNNRLAQLQGQTFLQAFNSLRGSGAITEMEGDKATNAIARLQRASTEKEFYDALGEARSTFAQLQGAVRQRAQRGAVVPRMGSGLQQPNQPPANSGGRGPSVSNW